MNANKAEQNQHADLDRLGMSAKAVYHAVWRNRLRARSADMTLRLSEAIRKEADEQERDSATGHLATVRDLPSVGRTDERGQIEHARLLARLSEDFEAALRTVRISASYRAQTQRPLDSQPSHMAKSERAEPIDWEAVAKLYRMVSPEWLQYERACRKPVPYSIHPHYQRYRQEEAGGE